MSELCWGWLTGAFDFDLNYPLHVMVGLLIAGAGFGMMIERGRKR